MTHPLETHRIGFIGCGAMARALAGGLRAAGVAPERLGGADLSDEQRQGFEESVGARTFSENAELVAQSDVLVLSVKPGVVAPVLEGLAGAPDLERPLWISIAAGIRISALEKALPQGARIIRTMPNTPALIGEGMTVICADPKVSREQIAFTEEIFLAIGRCRVLEEKHMDAVTGLSGSGPAFACVILEALADGGVRMGLPRDVAVELAAQTFQGAARMVLQTGKHPAALKDEVTTPAGCTIAGLLTMEDGRIRSILARTIEEAAKTASGLGRE